MLDRGAAAQGASAGRRNFALHPDGAHQESDGTSPDDGTLARSIPPLNLVHGPDFVFTLTLVTCKKMLKDFVATTKIRFL